VEVKGMAKRVESKGLEMRLNQYPQPSRKQKIKNNDKILFMGIDIGTQGAISFFDNKTREPLEILSFTTFDYKMLDRYLKEKILLYYDIFAVIEKITGVPFAGSRSSFILGNNNGWICGTLRTLGIPCEFVLPQKWKQHFNCLLSAKHSPKQKKIIVKNKVLDIFPILEKYPITVYDSILLGVYAKYLYKQLKEG
jgi:hypothetical protein